MKDKFELSTNECGIGAIAALYYTLNRKAVPISELRAKAVVTNRGIDMAQMVVLAQSVAIELSPVQMSLPELRRSKFEHPTIALIKKNQELHYVVLKVRQDKVEIWDPIDGKKQTNWFELALAYTGYLLLVVKNSFTPGQDQTNIKSSGQSQLLVLNLTFVSATIVSSLFIKALFDLVVPDQNLNALVAIVLLFVMLHLFRLVQSILIEKITSERISSAVARHELAYFHALHKHDYHFLRNIKTEVHLQNLQSILEIATWEVSAASNVISNFLICLVALILMISLAPALLSLVVSVAIFTIILNAYAFLNSTKDAHAIDLAGQKRLHLWLENFNRLLQLQNSHELSEALQKATNDLQERTSLSHNLAKKHLKMRSGAFILETFLPLCIGAIGVSQVINNNLSNGNLLLFLNMTSVFLVSQQQLSTYVLKFKSHKKKSSDFKAFVEVSPKQWTFKSLEKTPPKIEIANYRNASTIGGVKIKSLTIDSDTHILGVNGIGKSSLLLALYGALPIYGSIYWNQKSLIEIDRSEIADKALYLSSNTYLPSKTIADIWKLNNSDGQKLRTALSSEAGIAILGHFNLHLSLQIESGGTNLSTGQRQFVAALQAFQSNYQLILNDEALDHVDSAGISFIQHLSNAKQKRFIEVSHGGKFFKPNAQDYELKFEN